MRLFDKASHCPIQAEVAVNVLLYQLVWQVFVSANSTHGSVSVSLSPARLGDHTVCMVVHARLNHVASLLKHHAVISACSGHTFLPACNLILPDLIRR